MCKGHDDAISILYLIPNLVSDEMFVLHSFPSFYYSTVLRRFRVLSTLAIHTATALNETSAKDHVLWHLSSFCVCVSDRSHDRHPTP